MEISRTEAWLIAEALISYTQTCADKAKLFRDQIKSESLATQQVEKIRSLMDLRDKLAKAEWPT